MTLKIRRVWPDRRQVSLCPGHAGAGTRGGGETFPSQGEKLSRLGRDFLCRETS